MAHTTEQTPAGGWQAARLIQSDGTEAPQPLAACLVLDAVFPGQDLAVHPVRLPSGEWWVELPDAARRVLAEQDWLEAGQPHLGLVRVD